MITNKGLNPGPNLDELNAKAVDILNTSLGKLCARDSPTTVKLFKWTSHEIMLATTNAVYGPRNPFNNAAVQRFYYNYEAGLITLITGFLPSVFARASLKARDVLVKAFLKYFSDSGLEEGSSVYAKNRYEYPSKLGVPIEDVARLEAGGSLGLIGNSMPATFWTLYHAFSDPAILEDCRREVSQAVHEKDGENHLDLSYVKSSCPILVSTMQEAFRTHSMGISAREVMEDHMLGGKYLLKNSPMAWGDDVNDFNHKRFVKEPGVRKYNPVAFRAFGGGATLCPGRHFASTEILAFASVIMLRFDIKPLSADGWNTAAYRETNASFRVPNKDIDVQLIPRDNKKWHVFFSEPGRHMELSNEDIVAAKGAI
ncbi:hypothetical protein SLS53_006699 [Cytospora paraplurivora]|uniref:Cytochrome P450 n=1 Tax=Cytospora paraplurivora TaxID=2898453 RepID=A0AAN9U2P8_9PEZI